jgi:hypothetical protein
MKFQEIHNPEVSRNERYRWPDLRSPEWQLRVARQALGRAIVQFKIAGELEKVRRCADVLRMIDGIAEERFVLESAHAKC